MNKITDTDRETAILIRLGRLDDQRADTLDPVKVRSLSLEIDHAHHALAVVRMRLAGLY